MQHVFAGELIPLPYGGNHLLILLLVFFLVNSLLSPFFFKYGHRYSKAYSISAKGKSCWKHGFSLHNRRVSIVIIVRPFPCRSLRAEELAEL